MKFITAIYEHGVFRPTVPVALPEGTTVLVRAAADVLPRNDVCAPMRDHPAGLRIVASRKAVFRESTRSAWCWKSPVQDRRAAPSPQ